ncbi:MAG TPA: hypothetical protein VF627_12355 [Abditibacterium sp.]|jgi:hypothetical protein
MKSRHFLLVFLSLCCVCSGANAQQSKQQLLRSSAGFLFKHLLTSPIYERKNEYVFISCLNGQGKDITTATIISSLSGDRPHIFPQRLQNQARLSGDYQEINLVKPVFQSLVLIKWEVDESYRGRWRPKAKGGREEGSYQQSWVWLRKSGKSWKILKTKQGMAPG